MVFFVKEHLSVRSSLLAKMLYMGTERVQSITSSFAKDMAPTFIGLLPFKSAISSFKNRIWIHIYFCLQEVKIDLNITVNILTCSLGQKKSNICWSKSLLYRKSYINFSVGSSRNKTNA